MYLYLLNHDNKCILYLLTVKMSSLFMAITNIIINFYLKIYIIKILKYL